MPLVFNLASWAIDALIVLIIVGAILSWFRPNPSNPLARFIDTVTGPILHPLQALIPPLGGIDFSAIVAILLLRLVQGVILRAAYP